MNNTLTRNQAGVARNPFQGEDKRVLCVCSAGVLRSPTAAHILALDHGYNTRAAGVTDEYALIPVTPLLLYWADEVVCMEEYQADIVKQRLEKLPFRTDTRIVTLNIPDDFERMNLELIELIRERYISS